MQPDARDAAYLWDMAEAAREVNAMVDQTAVDEFLADRILLRATERCIEIIGESVRQGLSGVGWVERQRYPTGPATAFDGMDSGGPGSVVVLGFLRQPNLRDTVTDSPMPYRKLG